MKGDILIIDDNHRNAANQVVDLILPDIRNSSRKYIITVAGESGAGKSEIGASLAGSLGRHNIRAYVFGQDDYFWLPPKTNARARESDISRVGPAEVNLGLLERNLLNAVNGSASIVKPLVDFDADRIGEETVDLRPYQVLIAEGTYTSLLKHVDCRIFIDRNKMDTLESRRKRNREKQDAFLEQILTLEHEIISKHKSLAHIVISKEWQAILQK